MALTAFLSPVVVVTVWSGSLQGYFALYSDGMLAVQRIRILMIGREEAETETRVARRAPGRAAQGVILTGSRRSRAFVDGRKITVLSVAGIIASTQQDFLQKHFQAVSNELAKLQAVGVAASKKPHVH
jgi:hypothetical protein